jgi:hypothetical protein
MKFTGFAFATLLVLGGTFFLWAGVVGLTLSGARALDSLTALQLALAVAGAVLAAFGIAEVRRQPQRIA